jgi:hypothetical protein
MSTDEKSDQGKTYVLNETAFTKSKSIEELAEIAAGQMPDTGAVDEDNRDGSEEDKGSRQETRPPFGRVGGS